MLYGQKFALNRSKRNADKNKFPGKTVKVTKHFQPKLIYHNRVFSQETFPEINSEPDVIQSSTVRSYSQREPRRNIISLNKFNNKYPIVNKNTPKIIQRNNSSNESPNNSLKSLSTVKQCVQHHFKSKSCIEESSSLNVGIKETLKSKSLVEAGPQTKNVFTSDSNSFSIDKPNAPSNTPAGETSLDKIKKDIIINRIEGFRSYYTCSERKEKLLNLKKEISLLINPQEGEKCDYPADESAGLNESVLVYNVNETKSNRTDQKIVPKSVTNKISNKRYEDNQQSDNEEPQSK